MKSPAFIASLILLCAPFARAASAPTFTKDVAPIVFSQCAT